MLSKLIIFLKSLSTSVWFLWPCDSWLIVPHSAAAAKSLQSCPTLCDPIDVWQPTRLPRPWDSPGKNTGVGCHFLLQCMNWKVKVKSLSRVRLSATPWTAAYQAPPSMGFSRQEYWSGVPLPSPELRLWGLTYTLILCCCCCCYYCNTVLCCWPRILVSSAPT